MVAANWYLVKYVPDPFRNEPRNVGVVVTQSGRGASRFLAEHDGRVDGRKLGAAVGSSRAYKAWIEYIRYHLAEGTLEDQVDKINLRALSNYVIERRGVLLDEADPDELFRTADDLFRSLVQDEPEEKPPSLDELADKILFEKLSPGVSQKIERNVKYAVSIRGVATELDFDYRHVGPKMTLLERVSLNDRDRNASKRVNDFLYRMEHALESEVASRFLALYDVGASGDRGHAENYLQAIEKLSYTVNVRSDEAAVEVNDYLGVG